VDLLAVVFCPDSLRHARLLGRGWSPEQIAMVDSWQWPQARKVGMAQFVVDNSGSLDDLKVRASALIRVVQDMLSGHAEQCMEELQIFFENPDHVHEMD
jgi:23S rRNA pseudouridine1911/1915/1917 synthase